MKEIVYKITFKAANLLELIISILIIIVIAVLTVRLFFGLEEIILSSSVDDALSLTLSTSFNLVIGIELIKMLVKHSAASVIEVLVFSIARQMIVAHFGAKDILITIVALSILFIIRKYLLTEHDTLEKATYKGTQKVGLVNLLERIHIPSARHEPLGLVVKKELQARKARIEKGAIVTYKGFGLKVLEMEDDEIIQIEIIKQLA